MLKPFIFITLFGAALTAHAEILTFDYTGVIAHVVERQTTPAGTRDRYLLSSNILPGGVTIGDTFSGRLSYDTAAPVARWTTPTATQVRYDPPASGRAASHITFDASDTRIETQSGPYVTVTNNLGGSPVFDEFFATYKQHSGTAYADVALSFFDETGTVFDSTAIPSSLLLGDFYSARLTVFWSDPALVQMMWTHGVLTSLTQVTSVPEPSSYAMLIAGVALLGGAARRRARKQG